MGLLHLWRFTNESTETKKKYLFKFKRRVALAVELNIVDPCLEFEFKPRMLFIPDFSEYFTDLKVPKVKENCTGRRF